MSNNKAAKTRHLSYLFRFVVAAGALYLAFRGEDLREVAGVILGLNLWIFAAALGLYIISQVIFALRWYVLLKVQRIEIGFWAAVRLHFLGLFYNNCLPSSVGGDLLRAWYASRHTDRKVEAALSVFIDRLVGLTGMVIMAGLFFLLIPTDGSSRPLDLEYQMDLGQRFYQYRWAFAVAAGVLLAALAVLLISTKGRGWLKNGCRWLVVKGTKASGKTRKSVQLYWSHKLALVGSLGLTFCCQGIFIFGLWLIGRNIGLPISVKYYYVFFPVGWLLGALPISVGGLGVMEGGLKLMFTQVCPGCGDQALALAVSHRILWLLGSLPGVVVHLTGAHLPREIFVDYDSNMD